MRVVCISDTHDRLGRIEVPGGDVLIHAGDFTMSGQGKQIKRFRREIEALPHKHKIVIAGNHDIKFERDSDRARTLLGDEVYYLEGASVDIEGLEFYGHPWTPPFGTGWAFNEANPPMPTGRPDVLISHGPPRGILDIVARGGMNVGCPHLARWVATHPPLLHVFGHIHEGYGTTRRGDTQFVNASICTLGYSPTNAPVIVDL